MSALPIYDSHLFMDLSKLAQVSDRATDLRPVWLNDVQPIVTDFLVQQFDTEGAAGGQRWAALSPATIALRSRPGHGRGGIGRDTNRMWSALVKSAGSSAAPGGLLSIEPLTYERGTALPYARFFAGGYNSAMVPVRSGDGWFFARRKTPRPVPARPIFPNTLPADMLNKISTAVSLYITGAAQ